MFCFNEFAFTVQVKHKINSTQILGLILIGTYACIFRLAISTHVYFAKNVAGICLLILGSVFSDCVVFYGDS